MTLISPWSVRKLTVLGVTVTPCSAERTSSRTTARAVLHSSSCERHRLDHSAASEARHDCVAVVSRTTSSRSSSSPALRARAAVRSRSSGLRPGASSSARSPSTASCGRSPVSWTVSPVPARCTSSWAVTERNQGAVRHPSLSWARTSGGAGVRRGGAMTSSRAAPGSSR
ncbi:hypothetical protein BJF80_00260 [Serinicoccus sp. CUA-874]|nr:hypothetical protein BJF80_00260 [Serinicoccus sp. CUA-874]